jgi:hypothetical protein
LTGCGLTHAAKYDRARGHPFGTQRTARETRRVFIEPCQGLRPAALV